MIQFANITLSSPEFATAKTLEAEDKGGRDILADPESPYTDINTNNYGLLEKGVQKKSKARSLRRKNRRSQAKKRLAQGYLTELQSESREPPRQHIELKPLWTTKNPETGIRKSDTQLRRERRKRSRHNAKAHKSYPIDESGGGGETKK